MNRTSPHYSKHDPEKEKVEQQGMLLTAIRDGLEALINHYAKPDIITAEHIKLAIQSTEASTLRKLVKKAKTEVLQEIGSSPDVRIAANLIGAELQERQKKADRAQTHKSSTSGATVGVR